MRDNLSHLDQWRIPHPVTKYIQAGDVVGCFQIPHHDKKERERWHSYYNIISSADDFWEHVSIHMRYIKDGNRMMRCPTWGEMCVVKGLFFKDDETVVQYHPAKNDYVNDHPCVLHLFRHTKIPFPMPPKILV